MDRPPRRDYIGSCLFRLVFVVILSVQLSLTVLGQVVRPDPRFQTAVALFDLNDPPVVKTLRQADGKLLMYGDFDLLAGAPRRKIVRFNADYTVDSSFNCETCVDEVTRLPNRRMAGS
jgi:Domain of unknown function (DUF5122) beta-propeller